MSYINNRIIRLKSRFLKGWSTHKQSCWFEPDSAWPLDFKRQNPDFLTVQRQINSKEDPLFFFVDKQEMFMNAWRIQNHDMCFGIISVVSIGTYRRPFTLTFCTHYMHHSLSIPREGSSSGAKCLPFFSPHRRVFLLGTFSCADFPIELACIKVNLLWRDSNSSRLSDLLTVFPLICCSVTLYVHVTSWLGWCTG